MKMSKISVVSLSIAMLISSSATYADSRNAPAAPRGAEDYSDSYGYSDANGLPQPGQPYGTAPTLAPRYYAPADSSYFDERERRLNEEARVTGGLLGGAGGAVAGTFIAGHGSRLAGGLIGGGVGALVGLGIGALLSTHHHHDHPVVGGPAPAMGYDFGATDESVMYRGHWVGSMTGSWNGGPVRTWQGSFDSANGQTHWRGRYVDARGYAPQPARPAYGYGYGYRYAQPMYEEVLVPTQPVVTKTTRTYVSYVDVPVRTVHYVTHRVWHPTCGCTAAPRVYHKPKPKPQRIMGS